MCQHILEYFTKHWTSVRQQRCAALCIWKCIKSNSRQSLKVLDATEVIAQQRPLLVHVNVVYEQEQRRTSSSFLQFIYNERRFRRKKWVNFAGSTKCDFEPHEIYSAPMWRNDTKATFCVIGTFWREFVVSLLFLLVESTTHGIPKRNSRAKISIRRLCVKDSRSTRPPARRVHEARHFSEHSRLAGCHSLLSLQN